MNISLVLCPFWDIKYPPLSLALISSILKKKNYKVDKYDLNRIFYLKCKKVYRDLDSWGSNSNINDEIFIDNFIKSNRKLIDNYVTRIARSKSRMVGFTVYCSNRIFSIKIAERIKRANPDKIIVFGGPECFLEEINRELIKNDSIDIIATGEGDGTILELVEKLKNKAKTESCRGILFKKNGKIIHTGHRPPLKDLNSLPIPDFTGLIDLYRNSKSNILPIQTSRGCINRCSFCSEGVFWKKYRYMNAERIYKEVITQAEKYKVDYFAFHDSLINGNIKTLEEFCDLMIKNRLDFIIKRNKVKSLKSRFTDISWIGQAVIRPEMTKEILKKMKMAGCYGLSYGIESGSQKVLNKMNKKFDLDEAAEVLKNTHDAGISVQMNMMFGFPSETKEDFCDSMGFLKKVKAYVDKIAPAVSCVISKGIRIYDAAEEFGVINRDEPFFWESDNGRNNYEERFNRYEEFCKLGINLGIPEDLGLYKERPDKWLLLYRYYRYKGDKAKLKECLGKLSKTKLGANYDKLRIGL